MGTSYRRQRRGISVFDILVILLVVLLIGYVLFFVTKSDRRSRRSELLNNAKNIGLATHNFYTAEVQFPPPLPDGTTDPEVTKPISFFTALLPSLDNQRLYDKIDKGVAWTHAKNRVAYGTRVKTFEWPAETPPYYENEKTPAGYAIVHFSPNSRIISKPGEPFRMEDITDGFGTTLMLGTIDNANVPAWGDPRNMRDPANGFAGGPDAFGGPEFGATVVFADGRASTVNKEIDPKVAKALATPAGGEIVEQGDF